jgi:hypothetical protein
MQDAAGHDALAKGCLKCLLQLQQPELPLEEVLKQYKLAIYSAKFWTGHACKTKERIENIGQIAINLFSVDNPTYLIWIRLVEWLARKSIRSKCVAVPEPEGDWSPLDIAYFHSHEKMLENLSSSCRSLLGAKKDASQQRGKINGDRCIGCLHVSAICLRSNIANVEAENIWPIVQLSQLSGSQLLFHVQTVFR